MLIVHCKDAVRERLRAPDSADFSSTADATSTQWTGTVTAQNAFGVRLISNFTCTDMGNGMVSTTVTPR